MVQGPFSQKNYGFYGTDWTEAIWVPEKYAKSENEHHASNNFYVNGVTMREQKSCHGYELKVLF